MEVDFVDVTIPRILSKVKGNYRVKGGRAHNAYFNSEYSRDWDVECNDNESAIEIIDMIYHEAELRGKTIVTDFLERYNSYHLKFDNELEPFIDLLVITNKYLGSYQLDNVNYIPLHEHVTDALLVRNNRYSIYTNHKNNIEQNINYYNERLKDDRIRIDFRFDLNRDPFSEIEEFRNAVIIKMMEYPNQYEEFVGEKYKDFPEINEGKITIFFSTLFAEKLTSDNYKR